MKPIELKMAESGNGYLFVAGEVNAACVGKYYPVAPVDAMVEAVKTILVDARHFDDCTKTGWHRLLNLKAALAPFTEDK